MYRTLALTLGLLAASYTVAAKAQAQDIQFDADNGMVTVYGTNTDDICEVKFRHNWGDHELRIRLWYLDEDNDWKRITEYLPAADVVFIQYFGYKGDDEFRWRDMDDLIDEGYGDPVTVQYGGPGTDTLRGGPGYDYLDGGADYRVDNMSGDAGFDTFVQHYRLKKKYANAGSKESAMEPPKFKIPTVKDLASTTPTQSVVQVRVDERENIIDFNPNEDELIWSPVN